MDIVILGLGMLLLGYIFFYVRVLRKDLMALLSVIKEKDDGEI